MVASFWVSVLLTAWICSRFLCYADNCGCVCLCVCVWLAWSFLSHLHLVSIRTEYKTIALREGAPQSLWSLNTLTRSCSYGHNAMGLSALSTGLSTYTCSGLHGQKCGLCRHTGYRGQGKVWFEILHGWRIQYASFGMHHSLLKVLFSGTSTVGFTCVIIFITHSLHINSTLITHYIKIQLCLSLFQANHWT